MRKGQTTLKTTNLFVYGSLKPGEWNHRLIKESVVGHLEGSIEGVLVDLGMIPALVPGDGIVRGVLLEIDEAAIALTDRLEGHCPDRSFYRRTSTTVTLGDGQSVEAWVYEYATPTAIAHLPRLLIGWVDGQAVYAWASD